MSDEARAARLTEELAEVVVKHKARIRTTTYDGAWITVGREIVDLFDVERAVRSLKKIPESPEKSIDGIQEER